MTSLAAQTAQGVALVWSGRREVDDLRLQLSELTTQLLTLRSVEAENERLKQVLGSVSEGNRRSISPVSVVSSTRDLIIENPGYIKPNQVVLASNDVLVGVIEQVGAWTARVKTPLDWANRLPVTVVLADGVEVPGEVWGSFGAELTLGKVLTTTQLVPGAPIVTSPVDGHLPPRLLVGWVGGEIRKEESSVYQQASVTPAVDYGALRTVFILEQEE